MSRCRLDEFDLGSMRYLTQAGGAMTRASIQRMRQLVPSAKFFVMYGQTEATARLTYLPPEHLDERLGSVGIPLDGIEIQIRNGQGEELPPGEVGRALRPRAQHHAGLLARRRGHARGGRGRLAAHGRPGRTATRPGSCTSTGAPWT